LEVKIREGVDLWRGGRERRGKKKKTTNTGVRVGQKENARK